MTRCTENVIPRNNCGNILPFGVGNVAGGEREGEISVAGCQREGEISRAGGEREEIALSMIQFAKAVYSENKSHSLYCVQRCCATF